MKRNLKRIGWILVGGVLAYGLLLAFMIRAGCFITKQEANYRRIESHPPNEFEGMETEVYR